jgi:5-methylcytosine-specific restriction endonuclease McrA
MLYLLQAETIMKRCSKCHESKDATAYYPKSSICKVCRIAWQTEYARQHPEARRQIRQRYYERHRDAYLQQAAEYRARPEVQVRRATQAPHYRRLHNTERVVYDRQWRATNPERARANYVRGAHMRRARARNVPTERFSRQDVFIRDLGRCAYCAERLDPQTWHLDHVTPLNRGGAHTLDNVVAACRFCNLSKGPRTLLEWWREAESIAVRRRTG